MENYSNVNSGDTVGMAYGQTLWKKKKSWFVHLHQQLVLFIFYLCLCLQLLLAKKKISEPEGLKVGIFPLFDAAKW